VTEHVDPGVGRGHHVGAGCYVGDGEHPAPVCGIDQRFDLVESQRGVRKADDTAVVDEHLEVVAAFGLPIGDETLGIRGVFDQRERPVETAVDKVAVSTQLGPTGTGEAGPT